MDHNRVHPIDSAERDSNWQQQEQQQQQQQEQQQLPIAPQPQFAENMQMQAAGNGAFANPQMMQAAGNGAFANPQMMQATGNGALANPQMMQATGNGAYVHQLMVQPMQPPQYDAPASQGPFNGNPVDVNAAFANPQQLAAMQLQQLAAMQLQQLATMQLQPVQIPWMERPNITNCPAAGLEYLTELDHVQIKHHEVLLEIMTGVKGENKCLVLNSHGQRVYQSKEAINIASRDRAFELSIEDNFGQEVIHVSRPIKTRCQLTCCACCTCCDSCFDEVTVEAPRGTKVGKVIQAYGSSRFLFRICNEHDETVLMIHGFSYCRCFRVGDELIFKLMSKDGTAEIGQMIKTWGNWIHGVFTDADNFRISFPRDLDVRMKAAILAACYLFDIVFFGDGPNRYPARHGMHSHGMHSHGMHSHGMHSHGMRSHGSRGH